MTTHHRLTAKRVDALLDAAIYGAENMNEDGTISEQEYEAIIATIRLMHRRFVAGKGENR